MDKIGTTILAFGAGVIVGVLAYKNKDKIEEQAKIALDKMKEMENNLASKMKDLEGKLNINLKKETSEEVANA